MRPLAFASPRSTWITAALLAALLVILAVLQYRWIGEVSRAERQRLQTALEASGAHFADDLGHEVSRVFSAFQPRMTGSPAANEPEPEVAERWRRWRQTAPQPALVREVFVVDRDAGGHLLLARIDPATDRAVPAEWPAELSSVRHRLETADGSPQPFPLASDVPAVIVPLHHLFAEAGARSPQGAAIVVLDRRFLIRELFPELAERCFGLSRSPEYLVAVKGPEGLVYRSDRSLAESRYLPGDVTVPLLGPRHEGRRFDHGRPPGGHPPSRKPLRGSPSHPPPPGPDQAGKRSRPESPWRLVISHRDGSLEAAVDRVRWRNLAVSVGVLALLAVTLSVLAVSAQRARDLARQQIEFVAGLTHELNTPLAAIRSAGQNLADGLVSGPPQVQRYGVLIEREGRRLSGMVAKALELAGIQSGNRTYRPEPVDVAEVVDEALADCRWVLEERGVEVERDLPADLPLAMVDRTALRLAVQNLLDNAVKYAGSAGWIGVRVRAGRDGREVSVMVEDRGPGIRAEDRPHLFEPFYRGRAAAGGPVHGSGLGLSLVRHAVEANRGSLSVATGPGGSVFTIRLPVAPSLAAPPVPAASPVVETE
jgi:signal transduction histidine kinase